MDEDGHKTGLYRWQRQTKPRVQSRSHKVTSAGEIQNWIQKVEDATNLATDAAFGLVQPGKQRGKAVAHQRAGQVRDLEQAHTEAQELLTQWVNQTVRFDEDDGLDDLEVWRRAREAKYRSQKQRDEDGNKSNNNENDDFSVERLTRLALEDDLDIDETAIYERVKKNALGDSDPYANLYELDESEAVDSVLQNMLSKEVVREKFKKDLGFDRDVTTPDPRTKMEMRHKMVKENREKRQKEEGRRRMEAQMKKEARLKAQQLINKEQKDRESRARREEMELKKEMMRIRKEMHEERTKKEEAMQREREEKERIDRLAREELERQRDVEEKEMMETQRHELERRKKLMIQREIVEGRIATKQRQCLHRHFTAWYDLVLSRRLLLGKVKAMADWKLLLKVWGAWRSHVKGRRLEAETELHERNVIETERKKLAAERHHTLTLLRRCFQAWQAYVDELVERREMEREQERTKNKMMSLLSAVAEGKMWKEDGEKDGRKDGEKKRNPGPSNVSSARSTVPGSTDRQEKVSQPPRRKQAWVEEDSDSIQSSRSETSISHTQPSNQSRPSSSANSNNKGKSLPTQPWQVSRRHLKLTKKEISNLGHGGREEEEGEDGIQKTHTDADIRRRFGTQPWMNRQYVPNSFEHRYTAQQQTLREQQDEIREQRRLIEELQYQQRQQQLRDRLVQGADAPPLSPPVNIEAPPPGRQIPRGDEEEEKVDSNHDNRNCNSGNQDKSRTTSAASSRPEVDQSTMLDAVDTERSGVTTSRTERTTATNLSNNTTTSSATTAKTYNTKYLKVLKNMEDRAAERARLKAEREEKRRRQEDEKLAQLQREEEERQREMEAEKKAKVEAYRQKKRMEKQKEEERQKEQAHMEEMNKRAADHYTRSILKYRGLLPFKKLISLSKRNWSLAVKHRDRSLLRQSVRAWQQFVKEEMDKKKCMADQMHQFLLIKHCFYNWRNYKYHIQFLERRANRHYADTLRAKFFLAWTEWVETEREVTHRQTRQAETHYIRTLVRRTFLAWRYLPEQLKREEERQKRKLEMRQKVAQLIPDFVMHESVTLDTSVTLKKSADLS